jgi:glucokinase
MTIDNRELLTLGMDLGGTKLDSALVDSQGSILASRHRLIASSREPEKVIAEMIESFKLCVDEAKRMPAALGIGVAGQIDKTRGVVRSSPNLPGWQDVPLQARLERALKIPVILDNDVRVITRGEWQHGAGRGLSDLVCLFVGTGVGGGAVCGGQLLEGSNNTAGELGHITVVAGGRKCHCPNEGCLEAYVGGWSIAERAQDATRANPQAGQTLVSLAGGLEKISSITVSEAYHNDDPLAQRLIKDTLKYLSAGVISIVNAFNPSLLIMGGSVIQGFQELVPMVEQRVRAQALPTPARNVRISLGSLGNQAGVIGAAALARSSFEQTK